MHAIRTFMMAALLAALGAPAAAADFPSRPIRLVVPFEAGGTIDTLGRVVAAQIDRQSEWGIVVDNKAGANALIGTADAAKAAPDGHTILHTSPSFVINSFIHKKIPYDLEKTFVPITNLAVGTGYLLVVRQGLPVRNVSELLALARTKELTYGSPGIGNALHLAAAGFAKKAKIDMLHIPFKGSASSLNAIAAGQVDVMMLSPPTVTPYVQSGKIRPIAFTGEGRSKEFPDVPTMKEAGIDDFVVMGTWAGWFAPAGTPPQVVDRIAAEVAKALKAPEVVDVLVKGGFEPDGRPPAEFAEFVRQEVRRYGQIVKDAGVEPQ
ncbi:Tripartite tricarboxylate transporter family receptor [Pigmentiphaga humi]|uniref:Tripartite tricarboxylate transporter family receptor n=1 Tax=Pigmentiphaga humi TaxID=2478468 RepID=A0A3P4B027_9BURK|nr:tripartite tricarboxylate transporter substrate binding protein [Pigmentiphaga humi]VCU68916.1 Tripartite tricarboxylate transporter family receptor [Pigmentiphaga humi]